MARARNIKPGFFVNEDLVEMDFGTRLLFIGLWTMADRRGRLQDRPKKIKMSIFPADSVDVEPMLQELAGAGLVQRYQVGENKYIQILNFEKHQNPHKNEAESSIPAPCKHGASTRQESDKHGGAHADSHDSHDSGLTSSDEEESPAEPSDLLGSRVGDLGTNGGTPPCPADRIVATYHEKLPQLPSVAKLTEKRRKWLKARWAESDRHQDLGFWERYFAHVAESPFLLGDNDRGWQADFEWLVNQTNFYKTIEGKYHHA